MIGPFETADQAFAASAGLREAITATDPGGPIDESVRIARRLAATQYVFNALGAFGVELGRYDLAVIARVASWGPETTVTILDWALRAHTAGRGVLLAEVTRLRLRVIELERAAGKGEAAP